jgi:N-acyl-D-amino-acid deacylase
VRSTTDEVVRLAAVAGASGGRYISHLRSEDTYFWKALEEIIEVGEQARLPVQVSHIKLAKISSWGETDRLINRMNAARKAGVDITADIYPYTYWSSTIRVFFPELDYDNPERANYAVTEVSTPGGIHLATWMPDPSLEGKTLAEIAALRGDEPARVLMDMISELSIWEQANETAADDDADSVIVVSMTESDISRLMQWEHTNICSDGSDGGGHPRGYGTFPRVLGHYVRTKGVMDLALAVHKMTGLSADHMGIKDRGTLAAGMAADLVLFDPERIIDKATIEDPMRRSEGIVKVWVNGQIVYADGKTTGMLPGKVVRRQ